MLDYDYYGEPDTHQPPPKTYPASIRQLNYLWNLAEREGMDAEALASLHYGEDFADLTEDEANALIKLVKEG